MRLLCVFEAVVEHGADQNLMAERGKGAVAGEQRGPRREAAAGTDSGDHESLGVDTELGRVLRRPRQSRVAVLDRRGVGVLRRQSVLDRHDDSTPIDHMGEEITQVRPAVPHDHPATVDVDDASLGASVLDGAENQQSDVRRAFRPGYLALLHPHPAARRQILPFHPGEPLGHLPSDLWEGLVRHGWKSSPHRLLDGRELRVQRRPDGRGTEKVCCCLVCHLFCPSETTGSGDAHRRVEVLTAHDVRVRVDRLDVCDDLVASHGQFLEDRVEVADFSA
jgi:hypothetical protein